MIATRLKDRAVSLLKGPLLPRLLNYYPPYLGAGVGVRQVGRHAYEVSLTLRPWNRNYFGTHFGGSLYSMCDPFFVLILARALGEGFLVWDKSATIRFLKPGRGRVAARFEIDEARIEEIRAQVQGGRKAEPRFAAQVRDASGEVIAEVDKHLYVRRARAET